MNTEFVEAYYQTYNSEDPVALSQFYHDDVELSSSQGTQVGVDSILDTYRYLISIFNDQMTPEKITIKGDQVEVMISDRFTAKVNVDDFMGMALAAGDSFTLKLRGIYTVVDEKFKTIVIEQVE
ncbi:nuclear transport factor 2 family protein [Oceanicoccus sp. KOV_DT_Chl]|uniref:nuclear transport factor 2 family protein n=1 Tax=Oceanicoccus sp. KOV_DT_Chl TaxID=1904639 RepID=UPI000C7AE4D7|nr:nuclear transport factor 2 family protein [Oceanicoccus sp. KOV_DT_Chl]